MEQVLCKKWDYRGELINGFNCRLRMDLAFDLGLLRCSGCPVFKSEAARERQEPDWRLDLAADLADRAGYPLVEIAGVLKVTEDRAAEMIENSRHRIREADTKEAAYG